MKVLTVNAFDVQGGAARAAYRLHRSLLTSGIDSLMLVQRKTSDDYTVLEPQSRSLQIIGKIRPVADSLPVLRYKNRNQSLFSPAWLPFSDVVGRINELNPDIVHLHWINGGMLSIEDIARINVPIVWSLHDMWSFTGGCHYDQECAGYQEQCGNCPSLNSGKIKDLSRSVWQRKYRFFSKISNLNIIALSQWLADCAKLSSLFNSTSIFNLPNPIDTAQFSPFDKQQARVLFNLPKDKKLILFGVMGATSDPRKGFKELSDALQKFDSTSTELVVFGSGEPKIQQGFKQKVHYLGCLHDDVSLRVLYSAADVVVVPSLQENLSNTIMESLACGTPVVGFNVGGNSDLIEHQKTGYLARLFDTVDFAKGIEWVLTTPTYPNICENSRKKVLLEFDSRVVVKRYMELYQHILNKA
ncbi:MAG: glycosyltransferase family 4 protein [Methylomonas sp.]|jgi:glycosyltransferase involved in cell wall biosynthesis|uniref:glycosyltransferase family 4 protein n=1 Tax=Methylomonas sp. TaxID=418 RepID=UPI0025E0B3FD|nr:glycosyltransferase family 4 protein [Methylomonas sp.]MCK9607883.1 glycosyltransferase family 4 protein [Methylomonas sp.]